MNILRSFFATLADIAYTLFSGRRHCLLGGLKWTRTTDLMLIRHAL